MAGEVEREMRLFTKRLFKGTPDLSVLSQSVVRSKFLAHCGRSSLTTEERLKLKKIVEEELVKMQDEDASDDEPLIKVKKRTRQDSGDAVAGSKEPPGKRRKPLDEIESEEDSGIEQREVKRLSSSSPEAPTSKMGKGTKKESPQKREQARQREGSDSDSDVKEVLPEEDTTSKSKVKQKTGPLKPAARKGAGKDKNSELSSDEETAAPKKKLDVESDSEDEDPRENKKKSLDSDSEDSDGAKHKKGAQSEDSDSEEEMTLSTLKNLQAKRNERSTGGENETKNKGGTKQKPKQAAAKSGKRPGRQETDSESEEEEESTIKREMKGKGRKDSDEGNLGAKKTKGGQKRASDGEEASPTKRRMKTTALKKANALKAKNMAGSAAKRKPKMAVSKKESDSEEEWCSPKRKIKQTASKKPNNKGKEESPAKKMPKKAVSKKQSDSEEEESPAKKTAKKAVSKKQSDSEEEEESLAKNTSKKAVSKKQSDSEEESPAKKTAKKAVIKKQSDSDSEEESPAKKTPKKAVSKKQSDSEEEEESPAKDSDSEEEEDHAVKPASSKMTSESDHETDEDDKNTIKKGSTKETGNEGEMSSQREKKRASDSEGDDREDKKAPPKKLGKQSSKPVSKKKTANDDKEKHGKDKASQDSDSQDSDEEKGEDKGKKEKDDGDSDLSDVSEDGNKDKNAKPSKSTSKEDHPSVTRLKRYILTCGTRRNYKKLFQNCRSVKSMAEVLKKELEDLGVKGKPTLEKCRVVRLKREEAAELAELDTSNIIATAGRPRRQKTWNPYKTSSSIDTTPSAYSKEVASDSEGEEGPPRKKKPMDWSGLKGIISDDADSE